MNPLRNSIAALSLALACAASASAQGQVGPQQTAERLPVTAATAAPDRVRFAAPNRVARLKLEVLSQSGEVLSEVSSKGSVLDWTPSDSQGNGLADGSYLGVLTVKDVSGRITQRLTLLEVTGGAVTARAASASDLTARQAEAVGPVEAEAASVVGGVEATAATLLAHDGTDGQVVTTAGDLVFRGGDFFTGKDRELMRLSADGSLEVAGALTARGGIRFSDGTVLSTAGGLAGGGKGAKFGVGVAASGGGDGATPSATANRLAKFADASGTNLADSALAESGGFIGLGTQSPASLLHLSGAGGVSGITLDTPGTHRFRFQTVPGVPNWGALTLNANYNNGWLLDQTTTNGWFFKLDTRGGNAAGELNGLWLYRVPPGANPHADEQAVFGVSNGAAYFRDSVGIGTTSPQAKLDVAGSLRVTGDAVIDGNIAAKYQDVAEWVPGRGELPAGTVVVLDRSRVNGVTPSSRAYSTHVAGVVSAQPGVILGEGGPGQVMVATTGRVRVKVDATARPIRVGDLLVASDLEGVAMRSVPVRAGRTRLHRPGTIIGKALEPLASGRGEILVLLSMQ